MKVRVALANIYTICGTRTFKKGYSQEILTVFENIRENFFTEKENWKNVREIVREPFFVSIFLRSEATRHKNDF